MEQKPKNPRLEVRVGDMFSSLIQYKRTCDENLNLVIEKEIVCPVCHKKEKYLEEENKERRECSGCLTQFSFTRPGGSARVIHVENVAYHSKK